MGDPDDRVQELVAHELKVRIVVILPHTAVVISFPIDAGEDELCVRLGQAVRKHTAIRQTTSSAVLDDGWSGEIMTTSWCQGRGGKYLVGLPFFDTRAVSCMNCGLERGRKWYALLSCKLLDGLGLRLRVAHTTAQTSKALALQGTKRLTDL